MKNKVYAIPLNIYVTLSGMEQFIMGVMHYHASYQEGDRNIGVWLTKEEFVTASNGG